MDLGDLFEFDIPIFQPGPRGQKVIRVLFGLMLAAMCTAGALHAYHNPYSPTNGWFNAGAVGFFGSLALFGLLTVTLGMKSKWPIWLVPITFGALFMARVLGGP